MATLTRMGRARQGHVKDWEWPATAVQWRAADDFKTLAGVKRECSGVLLIHIYGRGAEHSYGMREQPFADTKTMVLGRDEQHFHLAFGVSRKPCATRLLSRATTSVTAWRYWSRIKGFSI